ncbi:membrane protein insertion efficiency factor YidD [Christensenella sp. MSJ-20]|uniref:membrane protein insertion efficiency factor YidD n=1 Tax=Christensenella sp. MSJ-20 TaxID=2841518 RepID=UPI001C7633A3|nr:membrane protein insertion efficiency factor YidD [Christensenella sp. MSJ-20]
MIKKWVLSLIRFYQRHVRHAPCCRFTPTCSNYAIQAVEEWGVIRGLGLAVWRVLRCNPFCKGGYDPVPMRKSPGG